MRNHPALRALALFAGCLLAAPGGALADRIDRLTDHLTPAGSGVAAIHRADRSAIRVVSGAATETVSYDDGEADNGYGPPTGELIDIVMRFDLPRPGMDVDQLSFCFQRLGTDDDLDFDITFWAADGPSGSPGTLLDFVVASASGVPQGLAGAFFTYDLTGLGVNLPPSTVYIGAGWDEETEDGFFACADHDGATVQPGFFDVGQDGSWTDLLNQDPDYTAMMYRGVFSDDFTTGPCIPGPNTLCLQDNRFRVEVDFTAPGEPTRQGNVIPLTNRAGLFWFFNENNVEMLIKVLDACVEPFDRYWVFYAATTNVEFEVRVTDTEAELTNVYPNPQGMAAPPIQDTQAFATCP